MKNIISRVFEFEGIQNLKNSFPLFISISFLILTSINNKSYSQSVPATGGGDPTNCASCTPVGWFKNVSGTPDISNTTIAADNFTAGGGSTWLEPIPLPPTGHKSWISLRDFGDASQLNNVPGIETVSTTMTGLEVGKLYILSVYALTNITNNDAPGNINYAGTYKTQYDYQIEGYPLQNVSLTTQNTWEKTSFIFYATQTSMGVTITPGEYAAQSNVPNIVYPEIEAVNITVELNAIEVLDSDNDGIPDTVDIDDDNDGILDTEESTVSGTTYDPTGDEDGDGLPNYLDIRDDGDENLSTTDYTDSDGNGIPDVFDADGDGIANHLDLDADGDGIPDIIEAQPTDSYIAPSGNDTDNDGLDDAFDTDCTGANCAGVTGSDISNNLVNTDISNDSIPDYLDTDSDNDGLSDTEEANISLSGSVGENGLDSLYETYDNYTDPNGIFDDTQTDNFPDEGNNAGSGGDVNWRDTTVNIGLDTDNDGIPNELDVDDDNDGILDIDERNCTTVDAAPVDSVDSSSGINVGQLSHINDRLSRDEPNPLGVNFNEDGDYLIIDLGEDVPSGTQITFDFWTNNNSDDDREMYIGQLSNDTYATEAGIELVKFRPGDLIYHNITIINVNLTANARYILVEMLERDDSRIELLEATLGTYIVLNSCSDIDTDNDGIPNYLDLDSDGDGIPDNIEAQASDSYVAPSGSDTDNDGLDDAYDTDCAQAGDCANNVIGVDISTSPINTDGDGTTPDYIDTDSDDDGTSDQVEADITLTGNVGLNGLDNNQDNGDSYADVNGSYDNDPYPDFENSNNSDNPDQPDWRDNSTQYSDNDGDGIIDADDLDDDNDGILDTVEGTADSDGDGIQNSFDLDSDNDGIPDNIEAQTTTGYEVPDGVFASNGVDTAYTNGLTPEDSDDDGTPDYLDNDSDNDGISDTTEAGIILTGVLGVNGLDNIIDNGDNYIDVNGSFDNSQADNFPDEDGDVFNKGDVDYRDTLFDLDNDNDGIVDSIDLDDDNDGILDSEEIGSCSTANSSLDWFDLYDKTLDDDPFVVNSTPTVANNIDTNLSVVAFNGSLNNYIVTDDSAFTNETTGSIATSALSIFQSGLGTAETKITIQFDSPVYNLSFTMYDINYVNDTGPNNNEDFQDNVALSFTQYDGSDYSLTASNYTIGNATYATYNGNNEFTAIAATGADPTSVSDASNITINSIPAWITKIELIFKNNDASASVTNTDLMDMAIGNLSFCKPLDTDEDGIFDYKDLDADNDGIPDVIEAQSTQNYTAATDSFSIFGIDLAFGAGFTTPIDTDGDGTPDYIDTDADGDGINDINEYSNSFTDDGNGRIDNADVGNNGLHTTLDNGDDYTDVNGTFDDTQTNNFDDDDGDVNIGGDVDYRDSVDGVDTDGDGVANDSDLDDDDDGILDTQESGGFDPDGDEDGDGLLNYQDNSDDTPGDGDQGLTNYTDSNADGIPDVYDTDNDGVPNHLDIDADNDGIPDNVEAQPTLGYVAPTGNDDDGDGLDNAYDTDCAMAGDCTDDVIGTDVSGNLVNTDSTNDSIPDYLDTDSDNDDTPDIEENGDSDNTVSGIDSDGDGLDDNFEGTNVNDGFDVNDEINTPSTDLPDVDSDVTTGVDVDYRDDVTGSVPPGADGNILWLRADIDVDAATVATWTDQTSTEHEANIFNDNPTRTDNALNYNPVIDFDGNDGLEITNGILGTASYTNLWSYVVFNTSVLSTDYIFSESLASGDLYYNRIDGTGGDFSQRFGANATTQDVTPPNMQNNYGLYSIGSTNTPTTASLNDNQAVFKEGLIVNSTSANTINTIIGNDSDFDIGHINNANYFNGQIAEIMVFNETPTAVKQMQIESYLAIKYGFTLSNNRNNDGQINATVSGSINEGDYILADQTTKIWDSETAYHNDIAGIGRDDAMNLGQYQSKSTSSDAIITIGLTSIEANNTANINFPDQANIENGTVTMGDGFTTNKDFLVWGNNDGSTATTTEAELICAPELTLDRTWKIVETGAVGAVELAVDKTTIDAALTTANTVKVIKIADDASFTTNVEYIILETRTILTADDSYAVDYDFDGTKYFTFSEVNGIFWVGSNGDTGAWYGGNSLATAGVPSTESADRDKVMVVDAQSTDNNPTLLESVEVECVWVKENTKLMVANDEYLEFDEDFILDGEIRLIGDAQLIQTHTGDSNVQGSGKLFRDRQAKVESIYRYHYWSSPVRELNLSAFRVGQVMKDGTAVTSETSQIVDINWVDGYDGSTGNPINIARYWIFSNLNDPGDGSQWVQQEETGVIQRGQGYSMKSTTDQNQNYTFVGTPNDGSITFDLTANTTSLLGNPYPSSIDAVDFIYTNLGSLDGTIYFWEHKGEDESNPATVEGHHFSGYQGGYSQRNITMGVAANSMGEASISTLDWENATVGAGNVISQTVDGVTATYTTSTSNQNLNTNNDSQGGASGNYLNVSTTGLKKYTSTISFSNTVDVFSIFVAKRNGADLSLTISPDNGDTPITKILNSNSGITVTINSKRVNSLTISGDLPYNLIIDDIEFREDKAPSLGDHTYTAPERYIAVGQGFFVSASSSGGTVRFENAQRAYADSNSAIFLRSDKKAEKSNQEEYLPILKLGFNHTGTNDIQLHRQLGISFRRGNTYEYESGYDSHIYDSNSTDFYWNFPQSPDYNLVIAGIGEITDDLEVPITIKTDKIQDISIVIDEKENINRDIYLIDKVENITYDLSEDVTISNLDIGSYSNRFYIAFSEQSLSINDLLLEQGIHAFVDQSSKELVVKKSAENELKEIKVFNLLGQTVFSNKTNLKENELRFDISNLSNSVYIVKVKSNNGEYSKKVIIK